MGGFSDPSWTARSARRRFRADKVIEDWCQANGFDLGKSVDALSQAEMKEFVEEHNIPAPPAAATTGRTSASLT